MPEPADANQGLPLRRHMREQIYNFRAALPARKQERDRNGPHSTITTILNSQSRPRRIKIKGEEESVRHHVDPTPRSGVVGPRCLHEPTPERTVQGINPRPKPNTKGTPARCRDFGVKRLTESSKSPKTRVPIDREYDPVYTAADLRRLATNKCSLTRREAQWTDWSGSLSTSEQLLEPCEGHLYMPSHSPTRHCSARHGYRPNLQLVLRKWATLHYTTLQPSVVKTRPRRE